MKNYLLYFLVITVWIAALPLSSSLYPWTAENDSYSVSKLIVKNGSSTLEMTLDEYVLGAMFGEMPYTYGKQALKAQAVALRSYAYYKISSSPSESHPDNALCTDSTCCFGHTTLEQAAAIYEKETAAEAIAAITSAVYETSGEILLYNNKPVLAMYHASSADYTESFYNLTGTQLDYLSVVRNVDEKDFEFYLSEKEITYTELSGLLSGMLYEVDTSAELSAAFNNSGRLELVCFGEKEIPAQAFLAAVGIKTRNVKLERTGKTLKITGYGYGNGIGMSQYGASVLAGKGYDYVGILQFYYTGVSLAVLKAV